jgi:AraC family transcriptional regulator, regulatory protein of adaptative response / methylated-DNA-[protein]-cysteine methyltransferase
MGTTHRQSVKPATTECEKWASVLSRNPAFDGAFYYAVATTGVYCRPSCPSRRANRENVTFYESCAAAENAGYRPCKRCHPRRHTADRRQTQLVLQACHLIETSEQSPKLRELAQAAGLSPHHFHREFKEATGLTPKAYTDTRRRRCLQSSLRKGVTVTEALTTAGFPSSGAFYAASTDILGMTPKIFRSGGPNETIRFAVGESFLGTLLVAQSQKGVCAILLGDSPKQLVHDLQDQFPKANLIGGDEQYEQLVAKVIGLIENPSASPELPLDIRGTIFQHLVWEALRRIPPGTTMTYRELAEAIGKPKAVRAVAGACAANKLAVAIPCHRVVRTDGSLSGYRWSVERKKLLLDQETNKHGGQKFKTR